MKQNELYFSKVYSLSVYNLQNGDYGKFSALTSKLCQTLYVTVANKEVGP